MKCLILYSHKSKPANGYQEVTVGKYNVFVRGETCEARDLSHALDFARPKPEEVVLNTIAVPQQ